MKSPRIPLDPLQPGEFVVVFCSYPSEANYTSVANSIIELKLAACVQVLPSLTSIYQWQGKVESANEILLIIKTDNKCYQQLEEYLLQVHPYECPEIIAVPITRGSQKYLQWISNSVFPNT